MLCDFLFMAGSTLFGRNHRIDKYRLALVLLVRIGTGRSFLGLVAVVAIDLLLGMRTLGPFTDQARVVFLVAAHALFTNRHVVSRFDDFYATRRCRRHSRGDQQAKNWEQRLLQDTFCVHDRPSPVVDLKPENPLLYIYSY